MALGPTQLAVQWVPSPSAELTERGEPYLYSPSVLSWQAIRVNFTFSIFAQSNDLILQALLHQSTVPSTTKQHET